ncbi:MAG: IS1595 family transposase, partial [Campylobacter sp.]|nr:IS1595 family transposase [Campylobacter sp.]
GIKRDNFILYLKECEFGYYINKDDKDLYQILLIPIRENPLKLS